MIFHVDLQGVCMRLDTLHNKTNNPFIINKTPAAIIKNIKKFTKRQVEELFFENCTNCRKMAAVPQSAFAVRKFQEQMNYQFLTIKSTNTDDNNYRKKNNNNYNGGGYRKNLFEEHELTPMKYSSKLMNSIWGLYNRYSVHNFKKNTDAGGDVISAALENVLLSGTSPTAASKKSVTEVTVKHHVG